MSNDTILTTSDLANKTSNLTGLQPPAKLSVFGDPVAHSLSPAMHNAALEAAGLKMQYVRVHVKPEEAAEAFRALPGAGFIGTNVTIPHKAAALEACDETDDAARLMGAVNTIVIEGEKLIGLNTDGPGLVRALREEFYVDLKDMRVVLLGAGGGAGRAIAAQCALEGCDRLVLVNRTFDKAKQLAETLAPYFKSDRLQGADDRLIAIPWETGPLREQIARSELIINATSVGMKRTDPPLLPQSMLTANLLVFDTVYSSGKTRLLEDAEAVGARAANGLSMLLHQGALSFEAWFNRPAPLTAMKRALREAAGIR